MTEGRQPDWDLDKARGEEAEALVRRLRAAILNGTVEVKRDDGAAKYGNAFVEFECKTADGWGSSGVRTTKATAWAIVFFPVVLVLPTWVVRNLCDEALARGDTKSCVFGSHPTRGAVIPLDRLLSRAVELVNRPVHEEAA